ncbi:MAG: hypothetical protein WDO14_12005 [Bacteroidota bacterium]
MKMKEQNAYMAVGGFCQLLFLGSGGAFVTEMVKPERSMIWTVGALFLALASLIVGIALYAVVFKEAKRKK